MAKKRRRRRQEEAPQVENRRETRLRARERERNLRLTLIIGGIVGVALILVLYSVVNELIIKPNSVLAQVEDKTIITRDFWQRVPPAPQRPGKPTVAATGVRPAVWRFRPVRLPDSFHQCDTGQPFNAGDAGPQRYD